MPPMPRVDVVDNMVRITQLVDGQLREVFVYPHEIPNVVRMLREGARCLDAQDGTAK